MTLPLAMAFFLGASPNSDAGSAPAAPDLPQSDGTHLSLWTAPLPTVVGALVVGPPQLTQLLVVPLGMDVGQAESWAMSVEFGGVFVYSEPGPGHGGIDGLELWLAAGPRFTLLGSPRDGLYVEPKFFTAAIHFWPGSPRYYAGDVELGVDLGWHTCLKRFYVGAVLGVGAGYCVNCAQGQFAFNAPKYNFQGEPIPPHPVLGFNLNVARLGWCVR